MAICNLSIAPVNTMLSTVQLSLLTADERYHTLLEPSSNSICIPSMTFLLSYGIAIVEVIRIIASDPSIPTLALCVYAISYRTLANLNRNSSHWLKSALSFIISKIGESNRPSPKHNHIGLLVTPHHSFCYAETLLRCFAFGTS